MENISEIISEAIMKATQERGHVNVLIAGRSGAGKSTLINTVFQQNLADTGQGRPVTKNTREIRKEGVPVSIFDTRGLEMSDFKNTLHELENCIQDRCSEIDPNRHIHVAWLCVQEDGRRVEEAEIDLHNMLARHVPLLTVITKSRSDNGFKSKVLELLPKSKNAMRVRAIREKLDEGYILEPSGLKELIEATSEVIPEGKRRALAAAQKVSLENKKSQSHKIVVASASAAGLAGASPIPFSDVALLAPIQVSMLAGISSTFGLELSKATLTTLISSALGITGATLAGRAIVTNLLKLFPGAGTVAGGAISAATASTITATLGEAYIATLVEVYSDEFGADSSITKIIDTLKKKMRS